MKLPSVMLYASIALMGLAMLAVPKAKADDWNQKTILTFSGPVEIPGQVLPAGTYVFKLLDSQSDRNIVQVFNKREDHLYGTFLAVPDYHLRPRGKTIVTFEERAAGAPEAVKAWFYPGDNYGHEFVYPKVRAVELAKANNVPVPSMPDEMAKNTTETNQNNNAANVEAMRHTPLKAQRPSGEAAIVEVFPPQASAAPPSNEQAQNNMPNTLPKTASDLPLFGLIGSLSLLGAGLLRYAAAKVR